MCCNEVAYTIRCHILGDFGLTEINLLNQFVSNEYPGMLVFVLFLRNV